MASYLSVLIQAAEPANYKLNYDEHYMISVPFATTSTPGIASFDGDYFKVVNGVVSLSDEYAGELSNIIEDIGDLQEGKLDKIIPGSYGTYVYTVRTDILDGVVNSAILITSAASPNTIVVRNANGRIKIANGVYSDEAVTLSQLVAATTDIQETALSLDVRAKLNKAISRVGISPEDWKTLPVADRDINTWYFVGPYGAAPNQYFVEYVYFVKNGVGAWEALGSTLAVDLSDYFTKSEINTLLAGKANIDGVYSGMSVGHADIADQINTDREIEDADVACPPVVFGTVGGAAEVQNGLMKFPELRGNTIKWNQLVQNGNFDGTTSWNTQNATISASDNVGSFTASAQYGQIKQYPNLVSGHKYLLKCDIKLTTGTTGVILSCYHGSYSNQSTTSTTSWQSVSVSFTAVNSGSSTVFIRDDRASDWDAIQVRNFQLFDLTDIYGAGKEPTTVAEFLASFPLPYYDYSARTLLSSKSSSVDFVKRNQWDEEWEVGGYDVNTGEKKVDSTRIRSKNFIRVLPNTTYFTNKPLTYLEYDGNQNFTGYYHYEETAGTFTTHSEAAYIAFYLTATYGTTYNNDVCIYINWDTPNLPYVAYSKQTITLPNIELRSVGDVYDVLYQQGGGKRRVGERAYQSGDENDPDVLTDGTITLYVLETETDIALEENPGWTEYAEIDNFGTVKFNQDLVQTIPVPQAYFVRYTVNLVEFLDSLYVHCSGDVSKIALTS